MSSKAVNAELLRGLVTLVKSASEFIEYQAEKEERLASQIPSVVDGLIDRGLIDVIDREKTAQALLNPEECLKAVKIAAKHVTPDSMGSSATLTPAQPERRAGYAPMRESDRRFEEQILS
jgi:hypothetical protein